MTRDFDRDYWEQHWRAAGTAPGSMGGHPPNPYLAPETSGLPLGTALDAGCGAGAEAPDKAASRVGDDLHVHAVALKFSGAVRPLVGNPVDRNQGAVQDRVRQPADPVHGGGQVIGGRREQGYSFLHVPPCGAHADGEPGSQAGVGITVAQVSQSEQCLPSRVEASPPGSTLVAVAADTVSEVV